MSRYIGPHGDGHCDCCDGTRQRAPVAIENRSGLNAVAYRSGTHADYFASLLAQLSSSDYPALGALKTRNVDDFSIALLDAFAATADVLTFYQERLANESYLGTATERQSIGELAKLLGYQLSRGVSANTDIVFTVDEPVELPPTAPAQVAVPDTLPVIIEAGTKIQSIPGQDEEPQLFESGETIAGHPDWNEMRPLSLVDQDLPAGTREIVVEGTDAGLRQGDRLLLTDNHKSQLRFVTSVEVDENRQRTRVRWSGSLPVGFDFSSGYQVFAVDEWAAAFGHNAVSWPALSKAAKAGYLGISVADYDQRVVAESSVALEWQGFTIFAPDEELVFQAEPLVLESDLEMVLAKVVETSDRLVETAGMAAQQAAPEATIDVVATIAEVIAAISQALASTNFANSLNADTAAITNAVTTLLIDLIPAAGLSPVAAPGALDLTQITDSLTQLFQQDADTSGSLNEVITSLNGIIDLSQLASNASNLGTAISSVNLLNQVLGDLAHALAPVGDAASRLGGIMEQLRQSLSNAAVTQAMGSAVKNVAEMAVKTGSVQTKEDLDGLVRYTVMVADAAVRYAPGTNLVAQFNNFMVGLDSAASAGHAGKLVFDDVVDVGQDAATLGVAAGGAAGVVALHPVLTPLLVVNMAMAGAAESSAVSFGQAINRTLDLAMRADIVARPESHAGYTGLQNTIDLDRFYPDIGAGDWVVLSAEGSERAFRVTSARRTTRSQFLISTPVSRLALAGPDLELFADAVRETSVLLMRHELQPTSVELGTPVAGRRIRLDRTVAPFVNGRKVLLSGINSATGEAGSELAVVKNSEEVEDDRRSATPLITEIEFVHPLREPWHRSNLRLFGNVASATHGETTFEVLGSGDATRAFQSFRLKQSPLTYVSADSPTGTASSLRVFVNDVEWTEVAFFLDQPVDARIYTTRIVADGSLLIRFGDGRNGARLPSGTNNVRAEYRKGTGIAGMVRKAQLAQLMTRPLGLKEAINPVAATGAADPEAVEDARRNAPLTVLTLDRAVSLRDYEDYANAFAGIAKAHAAWFWDGRQRVILLTVAGSGGSALDPEGATIGNLKKSLRRFGDPHVQFQVLTYRAAAFRFGARIALTPGSGEDIVLPRLEATLREHFSFATRRFAQPVVLSEVMRVAHQVPGVAAVDVDFLYRSDQPAGLNKRLIADQATLSPAGAANAAELLSLDPAPLDKLEVIS